MNSQLYGTSDLFNSFSQHETTDAVDYSAENFTPAEMESGTWFINLHASNPATADGLSIRIVARYKRVGDTPSIIGVTTFYNSDPSMAEIKCRVNCFIENSIPFIGLKLTGLDSTTIHYTFNNQKLSSIILT